MDPLVHLDDARYADDSNPELNFTRHGAAVTPLSTEDDIRSCAEFVVPSVPLGDDENDVAINGERSLDELAETAQNSADIRDYAAEDIHESSTNFDVSTQ